MLLESHYLAWMQEESSIMISWCTITPVLTVPNVTSRRSQATVATLCRVSYTYTFWVVFCWQHVLQSARVKIVKMQRCVGRARQQCILFARYWRLKLENRLISSSRLSKVIDLGANRKHICYFLFVISSNLDVSRILQSSRVKLIVSLLQSSVLLHLEASMSLKIWGYTLPCFRWPSSPIVSSVTPTRPRPVSSIKATILISWITRITATYIS